MITYQIKKATTDVSVVIRIIDSTDGTPETGVVWNTTDIDMEYRREGAVVVDITEATLATLDAAHSDGGFLHISNGYYRLDLPDAACATGANGVLVEGTVPGMVVIGCYIQLVNYDPFDTVRLGLTALPNAAAEAAGGLYTRGTGAGQINQQTAGQVDSNLARWLNVAPLALTSQRVNSNVGAMAANVLTATAINSGALTIAKFAADVGTTAYASNPIAKAIWERLLSAMVTAGSSGKKLSDIVLQTGDSYALIGAAGVGLTEAGGTGDHLTAINLPNQTMDITGNLSGSVGSVTGAVGSVTAEVTADVTKISGDATAADTLELFCEILNQSTGQLDNGSMDATLDTYAARVSLYDDDTGTSDRYTCKWYKNGELVTSGITVPKIQVVKDSDGTDLIAETAMTEVGSRGVFKYIATGAERTTAGSTYAARVTATIGGATRTDEVDVGRDT